MDEPGGAGRAQAAPSVVWPEREELMAFLASGVEMMEGEGTRERLRDPSVEAPGEELVRMQRAEWGPLGVDPDVGCARLDTVDSTHPGDAELLRARDRFCLAAQGAYLRALRDRRPAGLEREAPMPRRAIVDFFEACNMTMDLPETQEQIREHLRLTGQVPNQLIIDTQRDLLEVLGFERDHGCKMLSRVSQDFPGDQELHHRFEGWRLKAQSVCMRIVREHQLAGGDMPSGPFGENPEMGALQERAEGEIAVMTPADRSQLMQRLQKKVEVFMNLPERGRERYMETLAESDRLDFVKAQILLVKMMQQQWQKQQQARPPHQKTQGPVSGVAAPHQQEMM